MLLAREGHYSRVYGEENWTKYAIAVRVWSLDRLEIYFMRQLTVLVQAHPNPIMHCWTASRDAA